MSKFYGMHVVLQTWRIDNDTVNVHGPFTSYIKAVEYIERHFDTRDYSHYKFEIKPLINTD